MGVQKYRECKIISFFYEKNMFSVLQDKKNLAEGAFERTTFSTEAYNDRGKAIFANDVKKYEQQMVCFQLTESGRKRINLNHKKSYIYRIEDGRKEHRVQIDDIWIYFFRDGNSFLAVQLESLGKNKSEDQDLETALKFHAISWNSKHTFFKWKNKRSKEDYDKKQVRFGEIRENCFELLKDILGDCKNKREYNLAYMLTDEEKEIVTEENLQKFCLRQKISQGNRNLGQAVGFYSYCEYIKWAFTTDAAVVWGDAFTGGKSNEEFMKSKFLHSVFHNYLNLYLYYIARLRACEKLENLIRKQKADPDKEFSEEEKMQLFHADADLPALAEGQHKQLDIVMREKMSIEQWDLAQRLEKLLQEDCPVILNNMKFDVFISYRHDGGEYLALLVYQYLTKRGKKVFWDRESLKSGNYEQQIHKVIPECKNVVLILSEHCVERLNNEDDWVKKELLCAYEKEKDVLLIPMKNVKIPNKKELEHLPEGLQKLADYHAISVNAASFESDMRRVKNALIS